MDHRQHSGKALDPLARCVSMYQRQHGRKALGPLTSRDSLRSSPPAAVLTSSGFGDREVGCADLL